MSEESEEPGGFAFAFDNLPLRDSPASAEVRSTGGPSTFLRVDPSGAFEVGGYTPEQAAAMLAVYRTHLEDIMTWMDTRPVRNDGWRHA